MIRVLYFARLREILDCHEEQLQLPAEVNSAEQLRSHLGTRGPQWQQAMNADGLFIAVNHNVVEPDHILHDGDEVAFFPPVTGG